MPLAVLPLAFLSAVALLFVRRRHAPALYGLGAFVLAIGAGWWAIDQSRSSTAGIGFLFLPAVAAIAGALAAAGAAWRARERAEARTGFAILGWLGLLASLAIVLSLVMGGVTEIAKNRARDSAYAHTRR